MARTGRMPVSLAAYAVLLVVVGVASVVDVVDGARKGEARINLAVFCAFFGIGILRRSNTWRRLTVLFAFLLGFIACASFTLAFFVSARPEVEVLGRRIPNAGPAWCLVGSGVVLVFTMIELWILMRRPARDAMVRRRAA